MISWPVRSSNGPLARVIGRTAQQHRGLAKSAKLFEVPTILTTAAADSFSGAIFPEIHAVFPDQQDRTTMSTWEDDSVVVGGYGLGVIYAEQIFNAKEGW